MARSDEKIERIKSLTFFRFREMLDDFYDKGAGPEEIRESAQWFFNKARRLGKESSAEDMLRESGRAKSRLTYGKMYIYKYDPKWKDILPYYDIFPLVFPIEPRPGGFLGINLHYLPPSLRIALMEALYDLEMTGRYDSRAKLAISYSILKSFAGKDLVKPCIKSYLRGHVQSAFIEIPYPEWPMAAGVPVQKFVKASDRKVWADSRRKIG